MFLYISHLNYYDVDSSLIFIYSIFYFFKKNFKPDFFYLIIKLSAVMFSLFLYKFSLYKKKIFFYVTAILILFVNKIEMFFLYIINRQ